MSGEELTDWYKNITIKEEEEGNDDVLAMFVNCGRSSSSELSAAGSLWSVGQHERRSKMLSWMSLYHRRPLYDQRRIEQSGAVPKSKLFQ